MINNKDTFTIRADKTGTHKDDLRVLLAGTAICILFLVAQPFIIRIHDQHFAERPFVTATVEIIGVDHGGLPIISYDADATQNVSGIWIASIRYADESRITSRRGNGSYNNKEDSPENWPWVSFFDNEQNVDSPEVPNRPFKICVRYDVNASDSGVNDQTEKYCSETFDPNDPNVKVISVYERDF